MSNHYDTNGNGTLFNFQFKTSPNLVQSLRRRELGFFGLQQNSGEISTQVIDTVIHRQLIQSRAPKVLDPQAEKPTKRSGDNPKRQRIEKNDPSTNEIKNRILIKKWQRPERSHVLIVDEKVLLKNGKGSEMPYVCHLIASDHRGLSPVLKPIYSIPSGNRGGIRSRDRESEAEGWLCWDIWYPTSLANPNLLTQHEVIYVLEKPGHILQSFHVETGKKYKNIHLDKEVKFDSLSIWDNKLILSCVKATIGTTFDQAKEDFIIMNCPNLELVTRCRLTKTALENSSIEVISGEYIYIFTGHRIEICDLNKTIESAFSLGQSGFVPDEISEFGVPVTHLVVTKPIVLYVVENAKRSYLQMGGALWPPAYIKKDHTIDSFQVLPLCKSEVGVTGGRDLLNFGDKMVPHNDDSLCMHPDNSSRLILSGQYEIRIVLVNREENIQGLGEQQLEPQFYMTLAKPEQPQTSRPFGLRQVERKSYASDQNDEEIGLLNWRYCYGLDIFVILEFSSAAFKIHLHDNQTMHLLNTIDLSTTSALAPKIPFRQGVDIFIPRNFPIDIMDGYIAIRRCTKTKGIKYVTNLCIVNLLASTISYHDQDQQ